MVAIEVSRRMMKWRMQDAGWKLAEHSDDCGRLIAGDDVDSGDDVD
jgi:hypothetical protein